jgi:TIR domain
MTGRIFINYRRDDSPGTAGRVRDRLADAFGPDDLFMDIDNIPAGVDFAGYLNSQVAMCDVFLAIIGPNWLKAKDENGHRRLDNPDDFVSIEIAAALARDVRVIPVTIDGARLPKANELPDPLKPLVRRQALELRNSHFHRDAQELTEKVRNALKSDRAWPTRWRVTRGRMGALAAVAAVMLVGWVGLYRTVWVPWMHGAVVAEDGMKSAAAKTQPQPSQGQLETLVPETVPFIPDSERTIIRNDYFPAPDHKALAISRSRAGFITGQQNDETAKTAALANCQRASDSIAAGRPCELYAVGNLVVFARGRPPMPPQPWIVHDQSTERPFAVNDVPLINEVARANAEWFFTARGRKALALSPNGNATSYIGGSDDEVIRRSLEWCGSNAGVPCMIIAVDDVFVVPIPTTMKVVGFFRPDSTTGIASDARNDVARRIGNATNGWSAVAIGANGRPGLALRATNEQDAVDGALTDCKKQDRACRVIAINPFLVEQKSLPEAANPGPSAGRALPR